MQTTTHTDQVAYYEQGTPDLADLGLVPYAIVEKLFPGVCERTIRRYIQAGTLPRPIRMGTHKFFVKSEFESKIKEAQAARGAVT